MVKIVVITGGIASGKSFITEYLAKFGYSILRSDDIVNEIISSQAFLEEINARCNLNSIASLTELKKAIEDTEQILAIMEEILYPQIRKFRDAWLKANTNREKPSILEIPLFFEKNVQLTLSNYEIIIISTVCEKYLQIKRAKQRNKKMTDKMINLLISKQISNDERVARSTFIIYTDVRKSVVKKQLSEIMLHLR